MLVIMAITVLLAREQIWSRLEPLISGTDYSMTARSRATSIYLAAWRQNPLTGYGFGSSGGGAMYDAGIVPHVGYVALLTYFGLVGLVLYLLIPFRLVAHVVRVARDRLVRADPELRAMAVLGVSVTAIFIVNFVVGVGMYVHTWYLLGATLAAARIAGNRVAQGESTRLATTPSG